ncbi:MAG: YraN family protein [Calditrichaeota bacterium]|nr:YraN family protein [Calditrichota bacterium]
MLKILRRKERALSDQEHGAWGEELASRHLASKGLKIIDRNWRNKAGELDLVARTDELLIFVEVKSSRHESEYLPEHRVNWKKQHKIKRLAAAYCKSHRLDQPIRYDIVSVVGEGKHIQIRHIENAFS